MTHAQARRARRFLRYEGIPAQQAADAAGCTVGELRNARVGLGRDAELGGPIAVGRHVDDSTQSFEYFDAMMRSNRPVQM